MVELVTSKRLTVRGRLVREMMAVMVRAIQRMLAGAEGALAQQEPVRHPQTARTEGTDLPRASQDPPSHTREAEDRESIQVHTVMAELAAVVMAEQWGPMDQTELQILVAGVVVLVVMPQQLAGLAGLVL